jgi:hypothetical protein
LSAGAGTLTSTKRLSGAVVAVNGIVATVVIVKVAADSWAKLDGAKESSQKRTRTKVIFLKGMSAPLRFSLSGKGRRGKAERKRQKVKGKR